MPPLGRVPAVHPWASPSGILSLSFLLCEVKSSHSLTGLWGGILLTELDLHEEMKLTETKEPGSRPVVLNWRGGCTLGNMSGAIPVAYSGCVGGQFCEWHPVNGDQKHPAMLRTALYKRES